MDNVVVVAWWGHHPTCPHHFTYKTKTKKSKEKGPHMPKALPRQMREIRMRKQMWKGQGLQVRKVNKLSDTWGEVAGMKPCDEMAWAQGRGLGIYEHMHITQMSRMRTCMDNIWTWTYAIGCMGIWGWVDSWYWFTRIVDHYPVLMASLRFKMR